MNTQTNTETVPQHVSNLDPKLQVGGETDSSPSPRPSPPGEGQMKKAAGAGSGLTALGLGMVAIPFGGGPEVVGLSRDVVADKQLRVGIDKWLFLLKGLPASRERSLAIMKLQEAVMWLGMDLKRLNEPNPYPNSKDPSNAKVDPTADGLKL